MVMRRLNAAAMFLVFVGIALSPQDAFATNLSDYSILAQKSVHIKKKAAVLSGSVGVNEPSAGIVLEDDPVQLLLDKEVFLEEGTRLIAPSILIKRESIIHADIDYKDQLTIQDKVSVTGNINILNGPNDWPLLNLPIPPACTPDLTNPFSVGKDKKIYMSSGRYGDVRIGRNATVTLEGGTYHFNSFQIDREAKLYFSNPATICVKNSFNTKEDVFFGPQKDNALVSGADIRVYVNGIDFPEPGKEHEDETELEAAAKIGKKNIFLAKFSP